MIRYKEFSPTSFDSHINFDDNREDWFVLDVSQNRDSEPLSRSNFRKALEILGGESETVEVHRFGHWGPGWFELILLAPEREEDGNKIEAALADYPVLDDDDFSELEFEELQNDWKNWAGRSYVDKLRSVFSLSESTEDFLRDHEEELFQFHMKWSPYSVELCFDYVEAAEHPSRDDLAIFIKECKKEKS